VAGDTRSPTVARRLLGVELRSLREAAGLRMEDAAVLLECSTAKVSRLETGKGKPKVRDVRELLDFYGSRDHLRNASLLTLASDAQAQDWLSEFRDVIHGDMFASHLLQYVTLERDSAEIKQYEVDLIPGPLQMPEYIEAVCAAVYPEQSERERKRFIDFRLARQEILHREHARPQLSFIVSEGAILRPVGGHAVMRSQLETLHAQLEGDLKHVDLRIVPMSADAPDGLGGPFLILKFPDTDQDVVYLEGREGATYLETSADVARYERKFSALERVSLSRGASLERLAQEVEKHAAT
jgi:transcriptional regulator with XRE-family HTH domain